MEKLSSLFRLGIKYLYRYRRRYGFLLAALVFGFTVVTIITSLKDGMYNNVYYAAQSHYAGDLIAVGQFSGISRRQLGESEISAILNAAGVSGINPRFTVRRTLFSDGGMVFYNGAAIRLRYVMGCDWEEEGEKLLFSKMNFEGKGGSSFNDESVILSAPTAGRLGARIGDRVILEADTVTGQKNTGAFIVSGIVQDSSIFGYYKAYISRISLNRLILYEDSDCSSVGFFFDNPAVAEQKRGRLYNALAGQIQTGPIIHNRHEQRRELSEPWEGSKIFLYTLPVYITQISELLDAMNIITYFLYGMMLVIILVSAAVTYRLILHERTKELGVMRAIGFYGGDLRLVLWIEVITLGLISLFAGFMLAMLINQALSLLSFSWFPGFEIFLKNGKLIAMYLPRTMTVNVASIILMLLAAALVPTLRASRKNLSGLLAGEPL